MKVVILALALLACRSSPAKPPPLTTHDWGVVKFTEVRAFRMNWDGDGMNDELIRAEDGTLNKTRRPKQGIVLTASQIERLHQAVTTSDDTPVAGCFLPHHAFVFYDARGTIVSTLDVCFICGHVNSEPVALVKATNMGALKTLIEDVGLPISSPKWSFR
jgi:hypothetical protein